MTPAEQAHQRIEEDGRAMLEVVTSTGPFLMVYECRVCGEQHEPPALGNQRWCYGTARRPHLPMHVPGVRR